MAESSAIIRDEKSYYNISNRLFKECKQFVDKTNRPR